MQHAHATRRVGEALLREADPVDEGVGVAGEALGALVDKQVLVVHSRSATPCRLLRSRASAEEAAALGRCLLGENCSQCGIRLRNT